MDKLFKLITESILLVLFVESFMLLLFLWAGGKIEGSTRIIYILIFLGMANVHIYAYIIVNELLRNTFINIGAFFLFLAMIFSLNPRSIHSEDEVNLTINLILIFIPLLFTIPIMRDEIKRIILND